MHCDRHRLVLVLLLPLKVTLPFLFHIWLSGDLTVVVIPSLPSLSDKVRRTSDVAAAAAAVVANQVVVLPAAVVPRAAKAVTCLTCGCPCHGCGCHPGGCSFSMQPRL